MSSKPSVSTAFKTLDAWRAIAALMVVIYHTGLPAVMVLHPDLSRLWLFRNIRIGAYGVQIFFVISGYCIAQAAFNCIERKHGARAFALARLKRIYPPYIFASAAAVLLSFIGYTLTSRGFIHGSGIGDAKLFSHDLGYWLCSALLLQKACNVTPLLPLFWTLCYEAAFYLIVAAFLVAALLTRRPPLLFSGMHALTVLCSLVAVLYPDQLFYPFDLWPEFGLGILVFDMLKRDGDHHLKLLFAAIIVLMCAYAIRSNVTVSNLFLAVPREQAFVSVIFGIVLLFTYRYDDVFGKSHAIRWLQGIGVFSYSLYLTHPLTIGVVGQLGKQLGVGEQTYWISMIAQTLVSLPVALVFFRLAERPFMSKKAIHRVDDAVHFEKTK